MLTEVCQYLRNWFEREKLFGWFKVEGGILTRMDGTALPILDEQYFRVVGSVFNDGVHKLGDSADVLKDEPAFPGAVWLMSVPPVIVQLSDDVDAWKTANAAALASPYLSESFGGYSYSLRSGSDAGGQATGLSWESQFASRLGPWRKI